MTVFDLAGRREVVLQDQDADDCFPAVLAWIQSEVRVRLGRLIDAIGPDRMIACNTDGVLCEADDYGYMVFETTGLDPLVPREKARHSWVDVISPQHVITPTGRRLSGVPASAEEVGPHQYRWLTWPRLPSQIADGDQLGYIRTARSVDLRFVPVNRWRCQDGMCTPVHAELGEDGLTRLSPPQWLAEGPQGARLAELQHPALQQLLSAPAE